MWALGLLLLVGLFFAVGALVGLIWFLASPRRSRPKPVHAAAVPFGCAAVPVVGLGAAILWASVFQKSDHQLYQEVFGERTTVPEQSMLFDAFGRGRSREIYMRIYPDAAEIEHLSGLPGLTVSDTTLSQFASRGDQHGFSWWISSEPGRPGYCPAAVLLEADGFRGWREFRIAQCKDADADATRLGDGEIYVIAALRAD